MSGNKIISIVMPAYNAGLYISAAIDSVLNQSYSYWELLIINNGSTDNTGEIVTSYKDSRIRYFNVKQNVGVGAARNIGLREMNGDFFCFLDADDRYPPQSLESRLKVLLENKNVDFADGKVEYYDRTLNTKIKIWTPEFKGSPVTDLLSLTGKSFLGNTWMVRRQENRKYTFEEGLTHSEDLLFCIDLALEGGYYDSAEDVVLHYRTGHTSAMKDLKGLEKGYRLVYNRVIQQSKIPRELKETFRRKSRSIIFKSYLGSGQIINALWSYFSYPRY